MNFQQVFHHQTQGVGIHAKRRNSQRTESASPTRRALVVASTPRNFVCLFFTTDPFAFRRFVPFFAFEGQIPGNGGGSMLHNRKQLFQKLHSFWNSLSSFEPSYNSLNSSSNSNQESKNSLEFACRFRS